MEPKTVPLKWEDRVIGTCEVEQDEKGVNVISTNITDRKLKELLEEASPSFSINTKVDRPLIYRDMEGQ